jgi:hypothetical protein
MSLKYVFEKQLNKISISTFFLHNDRLIIYLWRDSNLNLQSRRLSTGTNLNRVGEVSKN